jgi:transposase
MSFIRKYRRNGRIYLAEVENIRIDGRVIQKFIRYVGVDPASDREAFPTCPAELSVTGCHIYGSVVALDHISKQLGFYELLGKDAPAILSLVYAHCHSYRSVANTGKWFEKNDLSSLFGMKVSEKMLHSSLENLENINSSFLHESIFEKISSFCEEDKSGVIYDGTNTHLSGSHSSLAMKGKDKQGVRGRKLIQIGIGVTRKWGFPIFHHTRAGNIHDTKLFNDAIDRFSKLGYRSGLVVFDRGITSKTNIKNLFKDNWKVLCGVPCHVGIKKLISKMDLSDLENFSNRVILGEKAFYVKSQKFNIGDSDGKLLILLDPLKRVKNREKRFQMLEKARDSLDNGEKIDSSLHKYFSHVWAINTSAIRREELTDGLSFLFTNARISTSDAVKQYFAKDLVEKAFQLFKGVLDLHPIRMWLDTKIKAHVTVCYLAYCLLSALRYILFSEGIAISPLQALDELKDVRRVYFKKINDKKTTQKDDYAVFSRVVTLSKTQEKILKTISPTLLV